MGLQTAAALARGGDGALGGGGGARRAWCASNACAAFWAFVRYVGASLAIPAR